MGWGWNRLHSNFDPIMGLNNAFGDMLLNFVMATTFPVLLAFWLASLTWVGIRAGHTIQDSQMAAKCWPSGGTVA